MLPLPLKTTFASTLRPNRLFVVTEEYVPIAAAYLDWKAFCGGAEGYNECDGLLLARWLRS